MIAVLATIAVAHAESVEMPAFPVDAQVRSFRNPRYFRSVRPTNDLLVVQMPLTAEMYKAFLNGTDLGTMTDESVVTLKRGDWLKLQWKRSTMWAEWPADASPPELRVVYIFDGVQTTNYLVLREENE